MMAIKGATSHNGYCRQSCSKQKGFTLVELMVVVAIIGILAAIAMPQFTAYRARAFNAAAESDLHAVKLLEEALFASFQKYGTTVLARTQAGTAGAGVVVTVTAPSPQVATAANVNDGTGFGTEEIKLGISNGVIIFASTDAIESSFLAVTGHLQGNRDFAVDSDAAPIYWAEKSGGVATTDPGTASTVASDDICPGPCTANGEGNVYTPL